MTYVPKNAQRTEKTTVYVKEVSKATRNFIIAQIVLDVGFVAYLLLSYLGVL